MQALGLFVQGKHRLRLGVLGNSFYSASHHPVKRLLAVVIQRGDPADIVGKLIGAGKIKAVFSVLQLARGPAFIADDTRQAGQ